VRNTAKKFHAVEKKHPHPNASLIEIEQGSRLEHLVVVGSPWPEGHPLNQPQHHETELHPIGKLRPSVRPCPPDWRRQFGIDFFSDASTVILHGKGAIS
jgi:hypothetical protein